MNPTTERAFDWIAVALIAAGMTYLALQFFGVAS
jgi:hypothetical protein